MLGTLHNIYFSPTGSSRTYVSTIADVLMKTFPSKAILFHNWTRQRGDRILCDAEDILVLGFPVYAGRVPSVLEPYLAALRGNHTPAIVAAVYGNRAYEDALIEAYDILASRGFVVVAAGAFIAEHSMTSMVGTGRPDAADLKAASDFARQAAGHIASGVIHAVAVKGNRPYREVHKAPPAAPKTTDACTECLLCAKHCPMGIINLHDPRIIGSGCLRCFSCVKSCPVQAKYFEDETIAKVRAMLEGNHTARKEPEIFV